MQASEIVKGILKYLDSIGKKDLAYEVGRELIKQGREEAQQAIVETAIPLEKEMEKEIEKKVGKAEFRVNPHLLGGMKVIKGDRQIDLSVRKKLEDVYAA